MQNFVIAAWMASNCSAILVLKPDWEDTEFSEGWLVISLNFSNWFYSWDKSFWMVCKGIVKLLLANMWKLDKQLIAPFLLFISQGKIINLEKIV